MPNVHDLWMSAMISIESRAEWGDRKRVWVYIGNQRFRLVNWTDIEEAMVIPAVNLGFFSSSREASQRDRNN